MPEAAPERKLPAKRRGNRLGFWFFRMALRLCGLRGAYGLLYFVCSYYLLFDWVGVRAALAYLRRRFRAHGRLRLIADTYRLFLVTLLKEHSTPGELAASAGVGILLAVLPLLALHTMAIIYVTTRLNLNRVVAVAIQNLCTPPFVPMLCIEVGHFLRHGRFITDLTRETWVHHAGARLWEWVIGSLILAPVLALITAGWVFLVANALQRKAARHA